MKSVLIYILLCISIFFAWCNQLTKQEQQPITEKIFSWTTSIPVYDPSLIISWNIITSSWLFTINFPKNLLFTIHNTLNQWRYQETLETYKDSWKNSRKSGYIKIFVENIPDWKKALNDEDKCVFGNYDEYVISKKTIKKAQKNKDIYTTYLSFSTIDNKRRQWDLCFIDNNLIYTVSVWWYSQTNINHILDSFTFID